MERNHVIIRFLPVLFNQLFKVLTQNDSDEVTATTTRYVWEARSFEILQISDDYMKHGAYDKDYEGYLSSFI